MRPTHLLLASAIVTTMTPASAHPPDLAKLELAAEPTTLLEGRLTVRAPAGARIEARGHGIMAAPEARARETRVVVDAGDQRLVLMAWERLLRAGDAFEAAVKKEAPPRSSVSALKLEGLTAWRVEPAVLDASQEAVLIAQAHVADAAGFVLTVAVYVNPPGVSADAAGVKELALAVLDTLRAGPRALDVSARDVVLERLEGGAGALSLELPAGWALLAQPGPDFTVHRLQQVVTMGQVANQLGVYVGHHPRLMHEAARVDAVEEVPGKLLGLDVTWKRWQSPQRGLTLETIAPLPPRGLLTHVFASAATPEGLAEARAVAEGLRIDRR